MFHFFVKNVFNVYLFLRQRERDREWTGEGPRERGRHRIWNRFQALSCQHRTWCRAWTHELWDHDLSQRQTLIRLRHRGDPMFSFLMAMEKVSKQVTCVTETDVYNSADLSLWTSGLISVPILFWPWQHLNNLPRLGNLLWESWWRQVPDSLW